MRTSLLLLALMCLCFGCREGSPTSSVAVPHVSVEAVESAQTDTVSKPKRVVRVWSPSPGVRAYVVTLPLECWAFSVATAPDPGLSVEAYAQRSESEVVFNGGFFDAWRKPLGLRVSSGKVLSPWKDEDWGVFFIEQGTVGIVHARDWSKQPHPDFALEAGPRVLVSGKALSLKPSIAKRTVIGFGRAGDPVVVVTEDPIDLNVLAIALLKDEHDGGLGLTDALNLDGGPSTQLYVAHGLGGKLPVHVVGGWGVPDAVEVRQICTD